MPFLATYWKQIAVIALGLIIFSFGWYKGNNYQKAKFDAFKLQIEVNSKLQEQKNSILLAQQKKVTENVTKEYADAIEKLNAYYVEHPTIKWLPNNNTSSSKVPSKSKTSKGTNGETQGDLSSTIRDCSLDVTQLLYLQKWLKDQELVNAD